MERQKYYTHSPQETFELGEKWGKECRGGEIMALQGELGAGKTVFVQGVAQGLGYKEVVNSPTFVLMQLYELTENENEIAYLCHIDAYRVHSSEEIQNAGVEDYLGREDTVCVVEWPARISDILPSSTLYFSLDIQGENDREISIKKT